VDTTAVFFVREYSLPDDVYMYRRINNRGYKRCNRTEGLRQFTVSLTYIIIW